MKRLLEFSITGKLYAVVEFYERNQNSTHVQGQLTALKEFVDFVPVSLLNVVNFSLC